jgi:protein PhnA
MAPTVRAGASFQPWVCACAATERVMAVRDSNGNELDNGDAVQVIKDLKVKGSSETLKRGTVFKNIRLTDDEEAIECGQGRNTVVLKTCFLKKA